MPDKISYVPIRTFKKKAHAKEPGFDPQSSLLRKNFNCQQVKAIDEEARLIDFIISTEAVDRMGDTISVKGWDLKNYKKNPVVLFGHDSRQPPIGRAVSIQKDTDKKQLIARAEFMDQELSPFAYSIFQMYVQGFMKATSVGFIPIEYEFTEEDGRFLGIDFKKQELLEFSAVPVPANPEALVNAKASGIDTAHLHKWLGEILDDDWEDHKGMTVPRRSLEEMHRHSDPKNAVSRTTPAEEKEMPEGKAARVTGMTSDHQHAYDDAESGMTDEVDGHQHPTVRAEDGTVTIGEADGHTHDADVANLPPAERSAEDEVEEDEAGEQEIKDSEDPKEKAEEEDSSEAANAEEKDEPDADAEKDVPQTKDWAAELEKLADAADDLLDALEAGGAKDILGTRRSKRLARSAVESFDQLASTLDKELSGGVKEEEAHEEEDGKALPGAEDDELLLELVEDDDEHPTKDDGGSAEDDGDSVDSDEVMEMLKDILPELIGDVVDRKLKSKLAESTGRLPD